MKELIIMYLPTVLSAVAFVMNVVLLAKKLKKFCVKDDVSAAVKPLLAENKMLRDQVSILTKQNEEIIRNLTKVRARKEKNDANKEA